MHNIPKPIGHYESSAMGHYEISAKRKFIALSAYIKKVEKSHNSDLTAHLKALEQKEVYSPRKSR